MEEVAVKLFWVTVGTTGSLVVGVISFLIRKDDKVEALAKLSEELFNRQ